MSDNKNIPGVGKASSTKNNVCFSETDELAAVTAQVTGGSKEVNRLYARRIVACVNACEGFPTDELEAETFEDAILAMARGHVAENRALTKQRDDLLAALQLVASEVTDGVRPTSGDSFLPRDIVAAVHAAIAKATGGAA